MLAEAIDYKNISLAKKHRADSTMRIVAWKVAIAFNTHTSPASAGSHGPVPLGLHFRAPFKVPSALPFDSLVTSPDLLDINLPKNRGRCIIGPPASPIESSRS
jgi:hypothetical protein